MAQRQERVELAACPLQVAELEPAPRELQPPAGSALHLRQEAEKASARLGAWEPARRRPLHVLRPECLEHRG